ncbi:MAG: nucleotide exchange factor GrpE [Armatimonadia bacterium]
MSGKDKGKRIPIQDKDVEPVASVEAAAAEGEQAGVSEETAGDMLTVIAELEAELAETRENHLRAVADLQNYRRRSQEERAQQMQWANEAIISDLLPVLDNFERATGCEVDSEAARSLLKGVCMVEQQLRDLLGRYGVQRIATEGKFFDPAEHEAVAREETNDVCEGTIVEELEPGYSLNGRVIRAARVKVAVQPH